MGKTLDVFFVPVKGTPQLRRIPATLEAMQGLVGGLVEVVPLTKDFDIWMNEEGKLRGLPLNLALLDLDGNVYDVIAGDCFIARHDDEGETVSIQPFDALALGKMIKFLRDALAAAGF